MSQIARKSVRVFISYAWESDEHKQWVRRLAEALVQDGFDVVFDQFKVQYGDSILQFVNGGIASSNWFLFVATDVSSRIADAIDSRDARRTLWDELDFAHSEAKRRGVEFHRVCVWRRGAHLPSHLAGRMYLDLRDDARFESELKRFVWSVLSPPRVPIPDPEPLPVFSVGKVHVPDVCAELVWTGSSALSASDLCGVYDDTPIPEDPQIVEARREQIAERTRHAAEHGQTFSNDKSYALRRVHVHREQTERPGRKCRFELVLGPTTYFQFIFPNTELDTRLDALGGQTPRDVLGMPAAAMRLEDVSRYRCHFRVGCGTVLVTNDERVVVSVRSKNQAIATGANYHLSTAEGMLRPDDGLGSDVSPFHTSIRSLREELGLHPDRDFDPASLRCLGLLLDTNRAQPYCVCFIRTPKRSFAQIRKSWEIEAEHRYENRDLVGLPWTDVMARELASGRIMHQGETLPVASNQAQAGYVLACMHSFGRAILDEER